MISTAAGMVPKGMGSPGLNTISAVDNNRKAIQGLVFGSEVLKDSSWLAKGWGWATGWGEFKAAVDLGFTGALALNCALGDLN
jgi:hypothetical protein